MRGPLSVPRPQGYQLKILPAATPVLGRDTADALARHQAFADLVSVEAGLSRLAYHVNVDLTKYDLDGPLPPLEEVGVEGHYREVVEFAEKEKLTVGQIGRWYGARTEGSMVGSASGIADTIERWVDAGAADGFVIQATHVPGSFEEFVAEVVPELQRRGRFRTDYEGSTLASPPGSGPASPSPESGAVSPPSRSGPASPPPVRGELTLRPPGPVTADLAEVARAPGDRLVCALRKERFDAGHIPGSVSLPYPDLLRPDGTLDLVEVRSRAAATGLDATSVVYCGGGINAAGLVLALDAAGLPLPRLYDGSLSEWRADPARPVESHG